MWLFYEDKNQNEGSDMPYRKMVEDTSDYETLECGIYLNKFVYCPFNSKNSLPPFPQDKDDRRRCGHTGLDQIACCNASQKYHKK